MAESNENEQKELRELICKCFNEEELKTLACDLEVNYEDLPADGRKGKARELVVHLFRKGRGHELKQMLSDSGCYPCEKKQISTDEDENIASNLEKHLQHLQKCYEISKELIPKQNIKREMDFVRQLMGSDDKGRELYHKIQELIEEARSKEGYSKQDEEVINPSVRYYYRLLNRLLREEKLPIEQDEMNYLGKKIEHEICNRYKGNNRARKYKNLADKLLKDIKQSKNEQLIKQILEDIKFYLEIAIERIPQDKSLYRKMAVVCYKIGEEPEEEIFYYCEKGLMDTFEEKLDVTEMEIKAFAIKLLDESKKYSEVRTVLLDACNYLSGTDNRYQELARTILAQGEDNTWDVIE
jgi:hypothetical protein